MRALTALSMLTQCDNCLIGTMFFFSYLSCICSLVACITQIEGLEEAADVISEISQIIWCSVRGWHRLVSVTMILSGCRAVEALMPGWTSITAAQPASPLPVTCHP